MAIRKVVAGKKKVHARKSDPTDYSEIEDQIEEIGKVKSPMTALFYGKSGTGKTTLLATFPTPLLLLDIREKGTESIADVEGIKVLRIKNWEHLEKVYWYLKSGDSPYVTVGLDQIGQMQTIGMEAIREEKGIDPGETFSQKNWGSLSGRMQTWLENFRNLQEEGFNVVYLAHDKVRDADEDEGAEGQIAPNVGARLMPSVVSVLNGMVSVIGNTFIRESFSKNEKGKKERKVQYCLRIGPHAYYDTKIRRPKDAGPIPDVVVNPSYKKLLAISRGEDVNVKKRSK